MFGFYVILTIAFLYIALMGGVIGYLIGKYWKKKQRMKKQIVLDEQDIKEFHEDAEHLRWIYNRMVCEHGESVNFDYMHRFAKIFNKLKQLQIMKIRLAKKIMKAMLLMKKNSHWFHVINLPYWKIKHNLMLTHKSIDHRITKAISLVERWNARSYRNEAEKLNKKNTFRPRDLRRSVERLKQYIV